MFLSNSRVFVHVRLTLEFRNWKHTSPLPTFFSITTNLHNYWFDASVSRKTINILSEVLICSVVSVTFPWLKKPWFGYVCLYICKHFLCLKVFLENYIVFVNALQHYAIIYHDLVFYASFHMVLGVYLNLVDYGNANFSFFSNLNVTWCIFLPILSAIQILKGS